MASAAGVRAESVRITAALKTESERKGAQQDLPRGRSRYSEKAVCCEFALQKAAADAPDTMIVGWAVLVERAGGRLVPGARRSRRSSRSPERRAGPGALSRGEAFWHPRPDPSAKREGGP